jgi:sorting nexin-29
MQFHLNHLLNNQMLRLKHSRPTPKPVSHASTSTVILDNTNLSLVSVESVFPSNLLNLDKLRSRMMKKIDPILDAEDEAEEDYPPTNIYFKDRVLELKANKMETRQIGILILVTGSINAVTKLMNTRFNHGDYVISLHSKAETILEGIVEYHGAKGLTPDMVLKALPSKCTNIANAFVHVFFSSLQGYVAIQLHFEEAQDRRFNNFYVSLGATRCKLVRSKNSTIAPSRSRSRSRSRERSSRTRSCSPREVSRQTNKYSLLDNQDADMENNRTTEAERVATEQGRISDDADMSVILRTNINSLNIAQSITPVRSTYNKAVPAPYLSYYFTNTYVCMPFSYNMILLAIFLYKLTRSRGINTIVAFRLPMTAFARDLLYSPAALQSLFEFYLSSGYITNGEMMLHMSTSYNRKEMRKRKLYFKIVSKDKTTGRVIYKNNSPGRRQRKYFSDPSFKLITDDQYSLSKLTESNTNLNLFNEIFMCSSHRQYRKQTRKPLKTYHRPTHDCTDQFQRTLKIVNDEQGIQFFLKLNGKTTCKTAVPSQPLSNLAPSKLTDYYITINNRKIEIDTDQACISNHDTISIHIRLRGGCASLYSSPNTTIHSMNVNSIRNKFNRAALITDHLIRNKVDFMLLQETWCNSINQIYTALKLPTGYTLLSDHSAVINTNPEEDHKGKGTAIIYKSEWQSYFQFQRSIPGRLTLVAFKVKSEWIIIASLYHPADSNAVIRKTFQTQLKSILTGLPQNAKIILGGDFNNIPNSIIDRLPAHSTIKKPRFISELTSITSAFRLTDIWRFLNPDKLDYTNITQRENQTTKTRIDYFLISQELIECTINCHILPSVDDDLSHSVVQLAVRLPISSTVTETQYQRPSKNQFDFTAASQLQISLYNKSISEEILMFFHVNVIPITLNSFNESITQVFQESMLRAAKNHIPFKRIEYNTHRGSPKQYYAQIIRKVKLTSISTSPANFKYIDNTHRHWSLKLHQLHYSMTANIANSATIAPIEAYHEQCTDSQSKSKCIIKTLESFQRSSEIQSTKSARQVIQQHALQIPQEIISKAKGLTKKPMSVSFVKIPGTEDLSNKASDVLCYILKYFQETSKADEARHMQLSAALKLNTLRQNLIWDPYLKLTEQTIESNSLNELFEMQELKSVINSKQNDSAPGPDEISYPYFKALNDTNLATLLEIYNHSYQKTSWNDENNKGIIITIPKKDIFRGDPKDLRPITLLQSFRKIFTSLLSNRASLYMESHNLFKGQQFGFRHGKSTSEALATLRHTIDHATLSKQPLYIALLDIEQAYDKIPLVAIQATLEHAGFPGLFIAMIIKLHTNRSLQISTNHGLTDPFTPSLGLAQGDVISPILFNIFYSPLLERLSKLPGYKIPVLNSSDINVNHIAYADDLTLIFDNPKDLQGAMTMVEEYLALFGMRCNPTKTIVVTNTDTTRSLPLLKINNTTITDIRGRTNIFRFLGCFWTLDGTHTQTVALAIKEASKLISTSMRTYLPGPVGVQLYLNSVVIPILQYRLQFSSIRKGEYNTIDVKLREAARRYCRQSNLQDALLYDKDMGYRLFNFQEVQDQRQITTTLLHQKDKTQLGDITRAVAVLISTFLGTPESILECPVTKQRMHNPFLLHISNMLHYHDFQLRTIKFNEAESVYSKLSVDSYSKYWQQLKYRALGTFQAIIKPARRNSERLQDSNAPPRLLSYATYYETLPKHVQRKEHPLIDHVNHHNPKDLTQVPDYYRAVQTLLTSLEDGEEQQTRMQNYSPFLRLISPAWLNSKPLPPQVVDCDSVIIYTDGSLRDGKMASAAIIIDPMTNQIIHTVASRTSSFVASSTIPELNAILLALQATQHCIKRIVRTDSQVSLDIIDKLRSRHLSERDKLKIAGSHHVRIIEHLLETTTCETIFEKVKAHSGDLWNDTADLKAKEAIALPNQMPYCPAVILNDPLDYHLFNNGSIVESYPSTLIKHNFQAKQTVITSKRIIETFDARFCDPDHPHPNSVHRLNVRKTKKLAACNYKKGNYLDATYMFAHKFRTQNITDSLTYFNQRPERNQEIDGTCPLCNSNIDYKNHLWACKHTKDNLANLSISFVNNFHAIIKENKSYQPIRDRCRPIPAYLIRNLDYTSLTELQTPWLQGFVTDEHRDILQNEFRDFTAAQINQLQFDLIDAWMDSVYTHLWSPRVAIISNRIKAEKIRLETIARKSRILREEERRRAAAILRETKREKQEAESAARVQQEEEHAKEVREARRRQRNVRISEDEQVDVRRQWQAEQDTMRRLREIAEASQIFRARQVGRSRAVEVAGDRRTECAGGAGSGEVGLVDVEGGEHVLGRRREDYWTGEQEDVDKASGDGDELGGAE